MIELRAAILDGLLHHRFTKKEVRSALRWLKSNYPDDMKWLRANYSNDVYIFESEIVKIEVIDLDRDEFREPKYPSDYNYPNVPPDPGEEILSLRGSGKELGYVIYTSGKGWKFYSKLPGVASRFLTSHEYSETSTEAIPPEVYRQVSGVYPAPQLHRNVYGWFTYARE